MNPNTRALYNLFIDALDHPSNEEARIAEAFSVLYPIVEAADDTAPSIMTPADALKGLFVQSLLLKDITDTDHVARVLEDFTLLHHLVTHIPYAAPRSPDPLQRKSPRKRKVSQKRKRKHT